ncbi:hypothetical protein [Colwellia sp. BRX8-9]|uniref:hypothetical protein n=1 Tax=Colwellia sp. BRX8-9 TaxID=2759831 RepID=UPI0015F439D5|nr:hypothetical protein [Colwellia sp. BRX8-9]MBA6350073.1 hypothetical protein [Colwellia sp. BRX8-9]
MIEAFAETKEGYAELKTRGYEVLIRDSRLQLKPPAGEESAQKPFVEFSQMQERRRLKALKSILGGLSQQTGDDEY